MRAAATGTDYINLISSSLTVSTDLPLPPSVTIRRSAPFLPFFPPTKPSPTWNAPMQISMWNLCLDSKRANALIHFSIFLPIFKRREEGFIRASILRERKGGLLFRRNSSAKRKELSSRNWTVISGSWREELSFPPSDRRNQQHAAESR